MTTTTTTGNQCESCGVTGPLYLHSRCHPSAPTWAIYFQGKLTIICSVCDAFIADFDVMFSNQELDDA